MGGQREFRETKGEGEKRDRVSIGDSSVICGRATRRKSKRQAK